MQRSMCWTSKPLVGHSLCNQLNKRCPSSFPAAPWASATLERSPPGFAMAKPVRGLSRREEKCPLHVLWALAVSHLC